MGRSINTGTLSKQNILSKVSQITIFSVYLNLSDAVIEHCIDSGDLILSPIRDDINPTCGFRYSGTKLKFKDFAGYFWGDCFDLVAYIMSNLYKREYNIANKQDFITVLRHITFMFKDIFYGDEKDINLINDVAAAVHAIKATKAVIELVVRDWNQLDAKYWGSHRIDLQDLNLEFVYPVDQYYINRNTNPIPKYYYDANDPCYAYLAGKDRNGINSIKLYFPRRTKGEARFITNFNHLGGLYTLTGDNYDIIVVAKATKDRIAAKALIKRLSFLYGQVKEIKIGFIDIPHETYRLNQNEYDYLKAKLKPNGLIVSVMDNDRAGKLEAIWLLMNFVIVPILIPASYKVKDIAELTRDYDFKQIAKPIVELILNINEHADAIIRKHYKLARNKAESNAAPF